jgi:hypothetical protein
VSAHIASVLTNEEWAEYVDGLAIVQQQHGRVRELVVNLSSGGPNAAQRKYLTEHVDFRGVRTAVLTSNVVVRGMVTALAWLRLSTVRAFAPSEFDEAAAHLGIEGPLRARVRAKVEEFRTILIKESRRAS